jgi:hypothetical protein
MTRAATAGQRRRVAGGRIPPRLQRAATYADFQARADRIKDDLLEFLVQQKKAGKKVVAYGAAAKGNTLLNYAGVKPDLLPFVCDAAPSKQGKFLPGSHVSCPAARYPAGAAAGLRADPAMEHRRRDQAAKRATGGSRYQVRHRGSVSWTSNDSPHPLHQALDHRAGGPLRHRRGCERLG